MIKLLENSNFILRQIQNKLSTHELKNESMIVKNEKHKKQPINLTRSNLNASLIRRNNKPCTENTDATHPFYHAELDIMFSCANPKQAKLIEKNINLVKNDNACKQSHYLKSLHQLYSNDSNGSNGLFTKATPFSKYINRLFKSMEEDNNKNQFFLNCFHISSIDINESKFLKKVTNYIKNIFSKDGNLNTLTLGKQYKELYDEFKKLEFEVGVTTTETDLYFKNITI